MRVGQRISAEVEMALGTFSGDDALFNLTPLVVHVAVRKNYSRIISANLRPRDGKAPVLNDTKKPERVNSRCVAASSRRVVVARFRLDDAN